MQQAGVWNEAERLVGEMRGLGLKPDRYTYNSVMNAYGVAVRGVRFIASFITVI